MSEIQEESTFYKVHCIIVALFKKLWLANFDDLTTGNDKLCTVLFEFPVINPRLRKQDVILAEDEYAFLECYLDNGNYFLMTTARMISVFENKNYQLYYSNYKKPDWRLYQKKKDNIWEGKTKIYRHYSEQGDEIWYEIDSGMPAWYGSFFILLYMREVLRKIKNNTIDKFLEQYNA